jgi:hypothetical protein
MQPKAISDLEVFMSEAQKLEVFEGSFSFWALGCDSNLGKPQ